MDKEILTCGNIDIGKTKNIKLIKLLNKTPVLLKNVDIEKVSVSYRITFGEKNCKCFIGYWYNDNHVKPLQIMLLNKRLCKKL